MNFVWKITELKSDDSSIHQAKYHVTAQEDDLSVETEGYWTFKNPKLSIPMDQVTEEMLVEWIEKDALLDGICVIKSRLEEQLNSLKTRQFTPPPWMPQTFSVKL